MENQQNESHAAPSAEFHLGSYGRLGRFVQRWYRKFQRPCVFVLLALAVFAHLVHEPVWMLTSLSALGFIVLEMLLEIHGRLNPDNERPTVFQDFYGVSELIRLQIYDLAERHREIQIRALGMSMSDGWPFLKQTLMPLLQDDRAIQLKLCIAMLDPNWDAIDTFNATLRQKANVFDKDFSAFQSDHSKALKKKKWSLTVLRYRHLPNWHGILLDDRYLYVSTCNWHGNSLTGAENPYEIVDGQRSAIEYMRVRHFLSWFERAQPDPA